jgi:hypothetical protein
VPVDLYYQQKKQEKGEDFNYNIARSEYAALSNSEKLQIIKKFENFYDENEVSHFLKDSGDKVHLATCLNSTELEILFESYGQPKNVPLTYYNHYLNCFIEKSNGSIKTAQVAYKNLTRSELEELKDSHQKV